MVNIAGVGLVVMYDIGAGANVYYEVPPGLAGFVTLSKYAGAQPQNMTLPQFQQTYPHGLVDGGSAQALQGDDIQKAGSYQEWYNNLLNIAMGGHTEAANDTEVRELMTQHIVNNMSDDELQARLATTAYAKNQSNAAKTYNDASDAEKQQMVQDMAHTLAEQYMTTVGTAVAITDPALQAWAKSVASGQSTMGNLIETVFKPKALENPDSPWAREIRTENQAQGQNSVDTSNKAQEVLDQAKQWGVGADQNWANQWAQNIVANKASMADLTNTLKAQAKVLYPWKDDDTPTLTAAQPWLETYAKTMETGTPDIMNPQIQDALTKGQSLADFGQTLRGSDAWLKTDNAKQTLSQAATEIGSKMGFN